MTVDMRSRISTAPATALFALLLALTAACTPTENVCTEIGCTSGLRIDLVNQPADAFTLRVVSEGSGPQMIECRSDEPCELFFPDFTPSAVTVTYRSERGIVERQFNPAYQTVRPNGEGCPPECAVARVVMELDL